MADELRVAWLAGLVDGEGAVYMSRSNQRGRWIYVPVFRIDMTCSMTIDTVCDLLADLDIDHRRFSYERKNKNHKDAQIVNVGRLAALSKLLPLLIPYLVTKRPNAEALLDFVDMRLAADHRSSKGPYESTYTGREKKMYEDMRVLNRRGVQNAN